MSRYAFKPQIVEAIQYDGTKNGIELIKAFFERLDGDKMPPPIIREPHKLRINLTHSIPVYLYVQDYLVRDEKGKYTVIHQKYFEEFFEKYPFDKDVNIETPKTA